MRPARRSSWSGQVRPQCLDPSTECCGWAAHAIPGFVGPPQRRASLDAVLLAPLAGTPPSKPSPLGRAGLRLGLDLPCGEEPSRSPSTAVPSPHASESEASQAPEDLRVQVPLAATLLEIYSGYADDDAEVQDRFVLLAFRRFTTFGTSEVSRERLHDAFIHMGFLTSTREHALELAAEVSKFSNFDFTDFCECVSRFAARERAAVRQRAGACLAERPDRAGGAAAFDGVQQFLGAAGLCLPSSHVEKARQAAGLGCVEPEDMSTRDLLLTLAACRVNEGFTPEEVAAAHEVFSGLEQEQRAPSGGWGPMAKASALAEGLLKFSGLYCVDYMDQLADALPSDSAEQPGVCFHEFLVWARRLRDAMLQGLWSCFRGFDTSGAGRVQLDTAITIAEKFGLSMLTDAVGELLSGLGLQNDTALDFDALVQFIGAAQRVHGFTRSEQDELSAAFQKFNKHGTGELTHLQVLDLLRYLGNTTSVDEVSSLIKRVDFNGNGSMDLEEFFRLMRMMREQDMLCVRKSFDKLRSSTGQMPKRSVKAALARRGLFPQEAVLAELLQDMPAEVCFTSFMHIYDRCRFRVNLESRKRAGFSEDTVEEIASLWSCDRNLAKPTTVGELIWMFTDSHKVPVHTSEGRHQLLRRVQAARGAALEAGVPPEELENEEEPLGSASAVGFYTLVHLIRSFVRDAEQEVIDREREAVSVARFPHSEAAEFRRVFSDLAEREARRSSTCGQPAAGGGQRVDQLLTLLTRVPAIPLSALPLLLKSIGLHVPSSRLKDLKRFLAQARSRVEADEGTIRFATFLRMMRWMLDTDFADICSVMNFRRV